MIPYELAQQLKDAGFPQELKWGDIYFGATKELWVADNIIKRPPLGCIKAPTLSELIEACGDKFWSLERDLDPDEIWGAYPANEIGDGPPTFGSTPTEAVARLWLALHFK